MGLLVKVNSNKFIKLKKFGKKLTHIKKFRECSDLTPWDALTLRSFESPIRFLIQKLTTVIAKKSTHSLESINQVEIYLFVQLTQKMLGNLINNKQYRQCDVVKKAQK